MFLSRNKANNVYPCEPQFYYIKVGFKGVKIIKVCFRDVHNFFYIKCSNGLCWESANLRHLFGGTNIITHIYIMSFKNHT